MWLSVAHTFDGAFGFAIAAAQTEPAAFAIASFEYAALRKDCIQYSLNTIEIQQKKLQNGIFFRKKKMFCRIRQKKKQSS